MSGRFAEPANGHIAIDRYSITVGSARVVVERRGALWAVSEGEHPGERVLFPDSEVAIRVAHQYAVKVDAAQQAKRRSQRMFHEADAWLDQQVYT